VLRGDELHAAVIRLAEDAGQNQARYGGILGAMDNSVEGRDKHDARGSSGVHWPSRAGLLKRRLLVAIAFTAGIVAASPALSWGRMGHQVIAEIAVAHLSERTKVEVDRLLALEPGATLASVSTWADEARSPATARWHYVNFPSGTCRYVLERDCPDGNCVVEAIEAQFERLRNGNSDEVRLKALKYLVHLVADIHQPLHAGRLDDRGGNLYQVRAFGRGTNLHALWDTALVERLGSSTSEVAAELMRRSLPTAMKLGSAAAWAEESCALASAPGFYPTHKLPDEYAHEHAELLRQRLHLAGLRLARVLDASLGRSAP
jgi:hypothetical protein